MNRRVDGHLARKRFGQNFLTDHGVIGRIADAIAPAASDHLVEIGPGQGALTEMLAPVGCQLDVVELDRDLVAGLLAAFSIYDRFKLHSADALKFDFTALHTDERPLRMIGNLPSPSVTAWSAPHSNNSFTPAASPSPTNTCSAALPSAVVALSAPPSDNSFTPAASPPLATSTSC